MVYQPPKCPSCLKDSELCMCDTWCDVCKCKTNHSTQMHEEAEREAADTSDDGEGKEEDGDYDETREDLWRGQQEP